MPDLTKLGQLTNDLVSTHDESFRTFDRLRRLDLDDEARQAAIDEFAEKQDAYDKALTAVRSARSKPTHK